MKNIRDVLLEFGAEHARLASDDPDRFEEVMREREASLRRMLSEENGPSLKERRATAESITIENWMAVEWARCAFPRVQLSHHVAARMMWTASSPTMLEGLNAPWPCFWTEVPTNLIVLPDSSGTLVEVTNLFMRFTSRGVRFAYGASEELFGHWEVSSLARCGSFTSHGPAAEMLANLMVGVCAEMTAHRPAPKKRKAPPRAIGRRGAPPDTTDYVIVERAVEVARVEEDRRTASDADCLAAVRAYVRGDDVQTTQRLVRGHHKMQTWGPSNSLRKMIFVEQYWQGPVDAPIAVRPHRFGSPQE